MADRLGVLGAGRMGLPILKRLLGAGHPVSVFDLSHERMTLAESAGASPLPAASEVASSVDVLITVLPEPAECEAAMIGPDGVLAALSCGAVWLDLTSNDPEVAARIASAAAASGVGAVAAPMRGGPIDAERGSLGFYLAGADVDIARIQHLLGVLGRSDDVFPFGTDVAAAHTAKLLVNNLWFTQVVAVTETVLLGEASGIDQSALRAALEVGPAASSFITRDLPRLLEGDYAESFGMDRVVEELDTLQRLAAENDSPSALAAVVASLHRETLSRFGPVDGEMLVAKLLQERAGRWFTTRADPAAAP